MKRYQRFKRRDFISLLSGSALFATSGLIGCQSNNNPDNATDLLLNTAYSDLRHRWLAVAIRAPSSHNMQPWLVACPSSSKDILVYVDPRSLLPAVDPDARQTVISLGGFLELLMIAARADGYDCTLQLLSNPCGKSAPVATVRVKKASTVSIVDELLPQILHRRTNRRRYYQDKLVSQDTLSTLLSPGELYHTTLQGSVQTGQVALISELASHAWQTELRERSVMQEMLRIMRVGNGEIERYRDGIAIKGFWAEMGSFFGMLPRDRIPNPDSIAMRNMDAIGIEQAMSASGWVWLTSQGNTLAHHIAAGRAFIRLHLKATQLGLALQPMTQVLGNYPAMLDYQRLLYQTLSFHDGKTFVQMLARIGYSPLEEKSIRKTVENIII